MSRWKAAAIHLGISAVLGVTVLALVVLVWYPGPLFTVTGGHKLMMLLIGVDIVIGPALTFAVFKSGKPGLKFDLSVIGLLQATAMTYGLTVILLGRPVYLVFDGEQFVVVHANALLADDDKSASAGSDYASPGFGGPRWVALELPKDPVERSRLTMKALEGAHLERVWRYYGPYVDRATEAANKANELSELRAISPRASQAVDKTQAKTGADVRLGTLPLVDATEAATVVVSRADGHVVDMIGIDPR